MSSSTDSSSSSTSRYDEFSLESSSDNKRIEEPWSSKGEELIKKWSIDIERQKDLHEMSGYYFKKLRKISSLPTVVIPSVMSPVSAVFAEKNWIKYVNLTAFILVGFLASVDSFYSFSTRKEKHFNHSARYAELQTEIDGEMFKEKKFRIQSDVFLTKIRMSYDILNTIAPVVPESILRQYEIKEKLKKKKILESV